MKSIEFLVSPSYHARPFGALDRGDRVRTLQELAVSAGVILLLAISDVIVNKFGRS